jgi:enamine deaminase RidA (YjgF/YER057c/UK114 family)
MSTLTHSGRPDPEAALSRLGLVLPTPAAPVAAYIPSRRTGNLLYISGQIPVREGKVLATGAVGTQVTMETARECARQCTLNGLAAAKAMLGSLDSIRQVIRVGCFVACEAGFADQPKVANGASELLVEIFGESGRHARAAVGTNALPLNVPVEIEFLFEVY